MKYYVVENIPGYMPESEPEEFDTLKEAQDHAQWLAADLRNSGYKVRGNKRDGYYGYLHSDDLGRVIEILVE